MTTDQLTPTAVLPAAAPATWVAIDIAKDAHVALLEREGKRQQRRVANSLDSIE